MPCCGEEMQTYKPPSQFSSQDFDKPPQYMTGELQLAGGSHHADLEDTVWNKLIMSELPAVLQLTKHKKICVSI